VIIVDDDYVDDSFWRLWLVDYVDVNAW